MESGKVDATIHEKLEHDFIKDALRTGVDLRQYSKNVQKELNEAEKVALQNYIKQAKNIANLHRQITSCDSILENIQGMLNSFQHNLGSISSEIQSLQQQSAVMSIKLKNRQAVRGELSQYVDELHVPQVLIDHILHTAANDQHFVEQLHELNHKIKFCREQSFHERRSSIDVQDVLESLRVRAVEKIREFLLGKVYAMRKPLSNYFLVQDALLKYRFFNEFLLANERSVAKEIKDEYVETMSKILFAYFRTYMQKLLALRYERMATRDDLIGAIDSSSASAQFGKKVSAVFASTAKGAFGGGASAKAAGQSKAGASRSIFTLGNRHLILGELDSAVILPYTVGDEASGASTAANVPSSATYPSNLNNVGSGASSPTHGSAASRVSQRVTFENVYRSVQHALVENASREYLFACDFFMVTGGPANELFSAIFGKTIAAFMKQVHSFASDCHDAIGALLGVHVARSCANTMLERGVPALSAYWDTQIEVLLTRFDSIVLANINSLRFCDISKIGQVDERPHYITRRFAEFLASILTIDRLGPDERIMKTMFDLQIEIENFLIRLAGEFSDRKSQLVLLINNYDLILTIVQESLSVAQMNTPFLSSFSGNTSNETDRRSGAASTPDTMSLSSATPITISLDDIREIQQTRYQLAKHIDEFVEEALETHFGIVMALVRDCEVLIDRDESDALKSYEQRVVNVVRQFNSDWRRGIEMIQQETMRLFSNFRNGTAILQQSLTQLMSLYHRLQKVIQQPVFGSHGAIRNELVSVHHLVVEMKKYKSSFT